MYVIVVGCGRVGSQLANFLAAEGHDVVVIDKNGGAFRRLGATFNGVTIEGLGFDEDVLKEAGAERADTLAAVTDLDNTNLMIVEVAKRIFKIPKVVARLYNPEKEASYQQFGLDYVCGTTMVAGKILDKIIEGRISLLTGRDSEVTEFVIADFLAERKVKDIEIPEEIRVAMIRRGGSNIIPQPDTLLYSGDRVVVAVKKESLPKLREYVRE
jgi:trk system potassium uptake protein TrkA